MATKRQLLLLYQVVYTRYLAHTLLVYTPVYPSTSSERMNAGMPEGYADDQGET